MVSVSILDTSGHYQTGGEVANSRVERFSRSLSLVHPVTRHAATLSLSDRENIMVLPIQVRFATMILERLFFILTVSLALLLMLGGAAIAQTTQSPLPNPEGYVNDYANVINGATKNRMETTLANLDREQQIQFAVVTVDTTGGQDIFDYSMAVARGWGLGSKDTSKPSLLLLVAIKDRKYFTQISRHLEGDLPDGLAGQIQRERIVPAFRAGEYGEGLSNTVNAYISTIAAKRGFSTDKIFAPGSTAPRGSRGVGGRSGTCAARSPRSPA